MVPYGPRGSLRAPLWAFWATVGNGEAHPIVAENVSRHLIWPVPMTRRSKFLLAACAVAVLWPVAPSSGQFYYYGRNKVQYENFNWRILQTEHFDIYYYPEMRELAEHGAHFAEEAYAEMQDRFNFSLVKRVPLIFYSSNLHFKQTNTTPGFIPDGVGGFFEFLKGRVVIPANGNLHRFRRVVRHELVHVFTFNKVFRVMRDHRKVADRLPPLWFTEGLAEYWSGEPDYNHEMVIRDALYSNYLTPLETMYRINGTFQMYKQGEAICRYIAETFGEEKLLEIIDNFWKDRDFRRVLEFTLKEDFDVLSAGWNQWLKDRYYPGLDNVQFPSVIAQGLSSEGFSAKPAVYRHRDGTRKLYFVGNRTGRSNVFEVEIDEQYRPLSRPRVLIGGETTDRFEAFHLFESRISVSSAGTLAFVTKSGEKDVIHLYDLETGKLTNTFGFKDLVAVYSPDWSPDSGKLVFSAIGKTGFSDLYVYEIRTGRLRRLTDDSYDDRDPSWSPDGERIAFSSDRSPDGQEGYYNIFTLNLADRQIDYVTSGQRIDLSPRWSPDGRSLVFASTVFGSDERFSAQNIWVAELGLPMIEERLASLSVEPAPPNLTAETVVAKRITNLSSAAFDPVWTADDELVFASFESFGFSIRHLPRFDSLRSTPRARVVMSPPPPRKDWTYDRLGPGDLATKKSYRSRYRLDIAQGQVSQSAVLGTIGGAVMAFSDMLGDDRLLVSIYNTADTQREFIKRLSFAVSRIQLHKRTNIAYGVYRFSGRRYDLTDPDAPSEFPSFFETIYGGYGAVSYPVSKFRRIGFGTSLNWSHKEVPIRGIDRSALLLSNAITLTHDNALYHYNGPVEGWRGSFTAAYTTDIHQSNVSYFTLDGDVRTYIRFGRRVTLASRFNGRWNQGREARLFVLGGSWDLRGFRLFSVRGQKMWFTSHELRFPIVTAPSLITPILAPFGIVNLRGALFFDAARAWNEDYNLVQNQINAGQTLGSTGLGLRLNLFGGFVLRYDLGWRYRGGFQTRGDFFKQFFFGWDF